MTFSPGQWLVHVVLTNFKKHNRNGYVLNIAFIPYYTFLIESEIMSFCKPASTAVEERTLVIMGDKGINDVVPSNFWESTKDAIISKFKNAEMANGLVDGILKAGQQLKKHFPYKKGDSNELSDEISIG